MCGIVVVLSLSGAPVEAQDVSRLTDLIAHRGPDDQGTETHGPAVLGFRRLSILDLSPLGHQPMKSDDGELAIVFNGEIYNYVELREELSALGHTFRSGSDTEVLLKSYERWGTDCVSRFNGMWAFVIADRRRRRIVASRDRFGIKPLYVYRNRTHLFFASEIKAIAASGHYDFAPDDGVVADFLARGRLDHTRRTFFAGVECLEPGTVLEVDFDGASRSTRFWDLAAVPAAARRFDPDEFQHLFVDAVKLHLRSDVPVGIHLSGGLDSTSILCAMAALRARGAGDEPLHAFSFIDAEFDERRYIDDTIRSTSATMHELAIATPALWETFERMIRQQDEPVHSPTPVVGYLLMQLARQHGVKVILNGQGADEVLGGYGSYFKDYWCSLLTAFRWLRLAAERRDYRSLHGRAPPHSITSLLARAAGTLLRRSPWYAPQALSREVRRLRRAEWMNPEVLRSLPALEADSVPTSLAAALRDSVVSKPLPLYLRIEDRNSMAHSVEARLPFLDYRLVEYAFSVADECKLRGGWNKYLLRESTRALIPESVRTRPDKMGFPVPTERWVRGPLLGPISDLLGSGDVLASRYFDVGRVRAMVDQVRRGQGAHEQTLFMFAQTELWLRNARSLGQRPRA
jgi:asparagine synthase (glutamine-hydrolysing)